MPLRKRGLNLIGNSATLVLFTLFMVYPLGYVLLRAFYGEEGFTLRFFTLMVSSEYFQEVIANSLNFAILVTITSSLVAYPIAFFMTRWDFKGKTLLHSLLLLPLILPPFVGVLGVRQIFGYLGTVNLGLMNLRIIDEPIRWLGSNQSAGIIILQVIHLVPILYLSLSASLKNSQKSLEEAAAVAGATPLRTLLKITIPLSLPGWFAGAVLVFVASFTDLGTPLLFEYRHVIPVQIFNMLSDLHENRVGYSFVVFTCGVSVLLFYFAQSSFGDRAFHSGGRTQTKYLGTKLPSLGYLIALPILLLYIGLTLLPHLGVIALSFSGQWFMTALPEAWTLQHYIDLLHHPLTVNSLWNSVVLSGIATILTGVVGFFVAYRSIRQPGISSSLLEMLTIVPLIVPGIVFAFGYVGAFSGTVLDSRINPFPLLIAAYLIRRSPYMVRSVSAGLQEVSKTMEEAGATLGASPLRVSLSITLPLVLRHTLSGALLTFAYCFLEVSDGLLLALEEKFYPVSKAMYTLIARPDGIELASALGVVVMVMMGSVFFLAEYLTTLRPISRSTATTTGSHPTDTNRKLSGVLALVALSHIGVSVDAFADERSSFHSAGTSNLIKRELVIVSPHWEGIKREFSRAFSEHRRNKYSEEVEVRWLDIGGTSDIVKYLRTQFATYGDTSGVDCMFGGGTDSFSELDSSGLLTQVRLPSEIDSSLPTEIQGIPLRSKENTWFSVSISTFGIIYNTRALSTLNLPLPSTWDSLGSPEYYGQIGAGDPRKSGSMHAIFEIILQGYGWDRGWQLIRKIARNVRNFSASATQVGKELALGEITVGIVIDSYASELIRRLGSHNLSFVVPRDFPALSGDAIAVVKGAPNLDLSQDFVAFALSEAGQRLISAPKGTPGGPIDFELGKLPVLRSLFRESNFSSEVKEDPYAWPSILKYDSQLGARRWNLVNDLFGTFIIDVHDRLRYLPVDALRSPNFPIPKNEAETLIEDSAHYRDAVLRSTLLSRWDKISRDSLTVEGDESFRILRWMPSLLFVSVLLGIWIRAKSRNLPL
jgi:iron(III) transport system permease protein